MSRFSRRKFLEAVMKGGVAVTAAVVAPQTITSAPPDKAIPITPITKYDGGSIYVQGDGGTSHWISRGGLGSIW